MYDIIQKKIDVRLYNKRWLQVDNFVQAKKVQLASLPDNLKERYAGLDSRGEILLYDEDYFINY